MKKSDLIAFEMMGEFGGPFQVSQLTAVYVVDSTMDQRLF